MSDCITTNPTTLQADTLEEGAGFTYFVKVDSSVPRIRIEFSPPRTLDAIGSVDVVSVTPSGPDHGNDWVEFTTGHIGLTYTVQVSYTEPSQPERHRGGPLETPSRSPKFKPQNSCPSS